MPKRKKRNISKWLSWIIPSLILLAILIVLIVGINKGWFNFGQQAVSFGELNIIDLFGQQPSGNCIFRIDDNQICLYDNVTGTIQAKSPVCYIGYNRNSEGWKFAGTVNERYPGFYEESRQATKTGFYEFTAICGTPTDYCRTNNVEVSVINCDDGDGDCDYTCGWVGEQCGGTCPYDYPLCVDMWNNIAGYSFCACIDPDTETIHPDWKPDGDCHDNSGFPDGDGDSCVDSDGRGNFDVSGYCTDSSASYTDRCIENDDDRDNLWYATDWYCDDNNVCQEETSNTLSHCQNGVEFDDPDGDCYNYCEGVLNYGASHWSLDWRVTEDGSCQQSSTNACSWVGGLDKYLDTVAPSGAECCCWCCNEGSASC